jgi:hypothetical protein
MSLAFRYRASFSALLKGIWDFRTPLLYVGNSRGGRFSPSQTKCGGRRTNTFTSIYLVPVKKSVGLQKLESLKI